MDTLNEAARQRENLALAALVKTFGVILLVAGMVVLLLGAFAFDRDRRSRNAMSKAMATVTEEYIHGGAYYITYEADGATHEALLAYEKGNLNAGDRAEILYDPLEYGNVRTDAPASTPIKIVAGGVLGLATGGLFLFLQAFLKRRLDNPWHDESQS